MKVLYTTGQMRSGTTLISAFLDQNKGIKIHVDEARVLTASGVAFNGREVDFAAPMNLLDRLKLFQAFINVTLWPAKNHGGEAMAFATKRLAPFMGYLHQIRTAQRPHITADDIIDLPNFRTHIDFLSMVLEHLTPITNRPTVSYIGNKETRGEDFASSVVSEGKKAIIVVRDPRAVVSSLIEKIKSQPNFLTSSPSGVNSDVDDAIQRWLKGYAASVNNSRIYTIRYEDFVLDHQKTVSDLSDYLDVELVAGSGITVNNSSFSDVEKGTLSKSGISRWREYPDQALIDEVTEKCRPQIESLGYDLKKKVPAWLSLGARKKQ